MSENNNDTKTISYRDIKNLDVERLQTLMTSELSRYIPHPDEVDESYDRLSDIIIRVINNVCPIKTKSIKMNRFLGVLKRVHF